MTLKDMKTSEEARIIGYGKCEKEYRQKILAMGLVKGTIIKLLRIAPLGDPIDIEVKGFQLTLRKKEADIILLEAVK